MDKETGTMHKSISAERRLIRLNLCIPYLEVESSEKEFAFQAKKVQWEELPKTSLFDRYKESSECREQMDLFISRLYNNICAATNAVLT